MSEAEATDDTSTSIEVVAESSIRAEALKEENIDDSAGKNEKRKLRIAVAGCSHGEMDKIYEVMALIEQRQGYKFDLLICCGDYQAVRNYGDLHHMHVKDKYKELQTFYKYYSGEAEAPVLTLFIGGNHEASGFLCELPNGGWVAPKIYYMGFASVVRFAGLRIAGLSGIYNPREFRLAHFERPPFKNPDEKVGVYHVRNVDMFRLKQLRPSNDDKSSNPIDIMISHDWPGGIADFGDINWLFRIKEYFRKDHESGKLGNPAAMKLLYDIRPKYWLSAHLHVAYAALVPHKGKGEERPKPTRFLSLDKPLERRQFLQSLEIEIEDDAELELSHDPEWLAILRNTDEFTLATRQAILVPEPGTPGDERKDFRPTKEEIEEVLKLGNLRIDPNSFRHTAPPLVEITEESKNAPSSSYYRNPQTAEFCQWLGIRDLNKMLVDLDPENVGTPFYMMQDENEIKLDQDEVEFGEEDFVIDRGNGNPAEEPPAKREKTEEITE
ncbi:unnamed protein product [Caenorhabditis bovis]|uniref:Lariat debranching enzyme C-terminal domain-containing protein n=1 Tax=Caenorhabditis bovis TaxID=2654633 RepID=A0A8S1F327_9PELO|nr:unnamed protein product [Caenorhabditis bovis]